MVITYSFADKAVVSKNRSFVGLDNYFKLFKDVVYWKSVYNTFIFVTVSVVAHLVIGMLFAMLLNSKYFSTRTKTIARVIYILPWVFTASVVAILWKLMLQPSGIVNYILSLFPHVHRDTEWLSDRTIALSVICFINIWCGYPFYMISILAGLQGISEDLYESAAIDGANDLRAFFNITIPQLKPILISIAMLDFIWTLQTFNVIWMLTGGGPVNSTQTLYIQTGVPKGGLQYGCDSCYSSFIGLYYCGGVLCKATEESERIVMVGGNKGIKKIISTILLILGALFASFPILWMICSSLKDNAMIFSWPPRFVDESFSLKSYIAVISDGTKVRFFINSYIVSICVVIATLLIGILAAYAFSRFDFPGKGILNSIIISVQAIPPIVLLIPYMGLIVSMKLFNSYMALILTYLIMTLPYCILMMTGYFNTLSRELDEAVMIDGGSRWKALWYILVPIALPSMVSVGMYTFMQAWNEYLFALALTQTTDMRTVPIGINLLMGQHAYDWSQMMAMSVLGSIPVLILFVFFQKYFIAGMSSGGVKG